MKKNHIILAVVGLIFCFAFISAISIQPKAKTYEYLSIIYTYPNILISTDTVNYETIKIKRSESDGYSDLRPVFKIVHRYEENGWELVNNNAFAGEENDPFQSYFLFRKEEK